MDADSSFVQRRAPEEGVRDLEQGAVPRIGPGEVLESETAQLGLERAAGDLATPRSALFPLLDTLKLAVILAIAGWFTFLYFSNDNVPVSSFRLSAMLPRPMAGWKAGLSTQSNPSSVSIGVGVSFEKFTSASVSRTYRQGDKEITVEIWDWAGDYPYHMPIDIPGWANGEPMSVGGTEGRLRYHPGTKKGRLRVRYLDRFYLIVEGKGIERYELESWHRRIDLGGLRRELDELRRTSASR